MARLLVVEENQDRAEAIELMLGFAQHEVDHVPDGTTALAYLKNGILPDGVIANVITDGVDGFHLCRAIKLEPTWAQLPVILINEPSDDHSDEALSRRAGAATLLRRPLQRDQLLEEVDRALLMAAVQTNPLAKANPTEETAFLRDYNAWLSRRLYQTTRKFGETSEINDLREAHLTAIDTVTKALGATLNLQETMQTLVQKTAELMRAQAAALYIHENDTCFSLGCINGFGIPTPQLLSEHLLDETSPIKDIDKQDCALKFTTRSELKALQQAFGMEFRPTSALASPLVARGMVIGFLLAMRLDENDPYTTTDAKTLFSLAGAAGLALRSAQLFNQLETAYEELKELDRRKSEFVAITSHELRTPLAIMLGYASLLIDMEDDPHKKAQLATIEKQANFLSGMVDALLNLHELSTDQQVAPIRCQPIQLNLLLKDALEVTLKHGLYDKTVSFEIDCDPMQIEGDEIRLLLAFNNLMDNAIKFSPPNSSVKVVAAERPEGGVVITIEDQGIGIQEEYFERIFEPFFQVEPAITRHYGGLGLGLAIVKGMVELHGGTIEVKSKVNAGSRFIVTLPARPPEERCRKY